jgi:hypothetical protein
LRRQARVREQAIATREAERRRPHTHFLELDPRLAQLLAGAEVEQAVVHDALTTTKFLACAKAGGA